MYSTASATIQTRTPITTTAVRRLMIKPRAGTASERSSMFAAALSLTHRA
jgi:hypothetical protein